LEVMGSPAFRPGPIVLFGSGETSPSGRKAFERVFSLYPPAAQVALLETPAGFELNSAQVSGRVAEFLRRRLQNYLPQTTVIPARKRGTPFSPDNPVVLAPMLEADIIFMGPGSPTYAVRQLHDSLAWHLLIARHYLGATLVLASAATVAISAYALPVYEIYKVGEDPHWKPGLDLFSLYGLPLVLIPHWNNNDGGDELDTSRCFVGKSRFSELISMLPADLTMLGIDEKTALFIDLTAGSCQVSGLGGVTLIHTGPAHRGASPADELKGTGLAEVARQRQGHIHQFASGQTFPIGECGPYSPPEPGAGLPEQTWREALVAQRRKNARQESVAQPVEIPRRLRDLVAWRQLARERKDWAAADRLRDEIARHGWQVVDTPDGPRLEPPD
jgi:hypothetical protein